MGLFWGIHLKTFKLHTVQKHDWNDVIADMRSGKLADTFILSPLAMNLIHDGFPGKIVFVVDRNGNGFVLSEKIKSIDELKNKKSHHRCSSYLFTTPCAVTHSIKVACCARRKC